MTTFTGKKGLDPMLAQAGRGILTGSGGGTFKGTVGLSRKDIVVWLCAGGAIGAVVTASDVVRYLMELPSSRLANPPRGGPLIVVLAVLVALALSFASAAWRARVPSSAQQRLASSWSVGAVVLWAFVVGYVLLVNYPVPAMAHHIDKFLICSVIALAWAACFAVRPDILEHGLNSRLYALLKVGLINVVVFLLIGELVLRLADPILARSGLFGDKHTPANLTPYSKTSGSIGRTNSQGFRDRERAMTQTSPAPRIIALGDSFTAGAGVSYDEAFVTLLERALQDEASGTEIINLGVPAWGPHEERHLLETYGIRFHPDLVLLNFFVGNDIQNKRGDDVYLAKIFIVAGQSYYVHSSGNWVHDNLGPDRWYLYHNLNYLFRISTARLLRIAERQEGSDGVPPLVSLASYLKGIHERSDIYLKEDTPFFSQHWERTQATLVAIRDFLKSRGIALVLVAIPEHIQLDQDLQNKYFLVFELLPERYDFEKPQKLLRAWSAEQNVMLVDLFPIFKSQGKPATLYFVNDFHLSPSGHALAASSILPVLRGLIAKLHKTEAGV